MSRIGSWIVEQEEAGKLEYNDETRQYEPVDTTECSYCLKKTAEPIEDSEGEAICLDCYTARRDSYKDALDAQFDNPLEQVAGMGVVK